MLYFSITIMTTNMFGTLACGLPVGWLRVLALLLLLAWHFCPALPLALSAARRWPTGCALLSLFAPRALLVACHTCGSGAIGLLLHPLCRRHRVRVVVVRVRRRGADPAYGARSVWCPSCLLSPVLACSFRRAAGCWPSLGLFCFPVPRPALNSCGLRLWLRVCGLRMLTLRSVQM